MVQPLKAHVPKRRIEDLAFINHNLAADDFVARRGVAGERNLVHVELAVFIDVDVQIDEFLAFIEILDRHRGEIDVAARTVELLQILEAFSKAFFVEDLAGDQAENQFDHSFVVLLVAGDLHVPDTILVVFFDIDRDVVPVERLLPEWQRYAPRERRPNKRECAMGLVRLGFNNGIQNVRAHISMLGIEHADPREIVGKLEVEIGVFAVEDGQWAGLFDQLHRLFDLAG